MHIFQLIEDYHTLKRPDLLKSSQKTQLSLEIDGKLHSEKKVHTCKSQDVNFWVGKGDVLILE